jgi:tetratricopeptide (TPR) repeat protein
VNTKSINRTRKEAKMKPLNTLKMTGTFLLMAAVGFTGTSTWAEEAEGDENAAPGYQMTVVLDRAEGQTIAYGNYERAILRLPRHGGSTPYANYTNLCVAHTMVGQYKHAQHYCDEALKAAEKQAEFGRRKDRDYTSNWAIALSNRGVLKTRMGDAEGARDDFRAAIELKSNTGVPTHNMANLSAETAETIVVR